MRTSGRGNRAERLVVAELVTHGYIVGSRRHLGGAGDLLAHRWPEIPLLGRPSARSRELPLLVEVKATTEIPWASSAHFGPADREAMIEAGVLYDVVPLLAWVPPHLGGIVWLPVEDWP